jgi:signal-transduction protein with cAMP-binding, CBS, and nucleotidyltransferase domain
VLYTRLYALRDGVGETNTWSRIRALAESGTFGHSLAADCMDSYGFLCTLRIERQTEGPKLSLKSLKARDEASLREAFAQAALIQKKIGFDFPGAALG